MAMPEKHGGSGRSFGMEKTGEGGSDRKKNGAICAAIETSIEFGEF